jgi:hypothetical protein
VVAFSGLLRADIVTDWNATFVAAIRNENTAPPLAARNLAILHTAMYDAVNAVERTHKPYFVEFPATSTGSREAAVLGAARRVSISLYPSQRAAFETLFASALAGVPEGPARGEGLNLGEAVADAILAWRNSDGSTTSVPFIPRTEPGAWRRTPPFFRPPDLPHWPYVTPFALTHGAQFRPPGPPGLTSSQYTFDFDQVKSLGATNSTTRTPDQTAIARFWLSGVGTMTPPGQWNLIARNVAVVRGTSLSENARLFALLNIAIADGTIAAWDAKYNTYSFWRPVTAIREAETDGNPETASDPEWTPLLLTPPHPDYVSGHATTSSAGATILAGVFGTDSVSFSVGSDDLPGVVRNFSSFADAARECGMSRIYAGLHFHTAIVDGQYLGRSIATYVLRNFLLPRPAPPVLALPAGRFRFQIVGNTGTAYVIEASSDLKAWQPIFTNRGSFAFEDLQAPTLPQRFYRAREVQ